MASSELESSPHSQDWKNALTIKEIQKFSQNYIHFKAQQSQQALETLIELLHVYNEQQNEQQIREWLVPYIIDLRTQCAVAQENFENRFTTYFHGVYKNWYLYSTEHICWARNNLTNETDFLDDFPPEIYPLDPINIVTILPRCVIEKILLNDSMNGSLNSSSTNNNSTNDSVNTSTSASENDDYGQQNYNIDIVIQK